MKVGVMTFPHSTSCGAVLQMYALCCAVEKLGHSAEAIHYHNAFMKAGKHTRSTSSGKYFLQLMRFCARSVLHRRLERAFREFENRFVPLYPEKSFSDKKKLSLADKRYDAVICGSDQVWNPDITDRDLSYFLDFCTERTGRIAYAPSFGVEDLEEEYAASVRKELMQFAALSVREASGQTLISRLTGKDAPVVLDPTMLLEAAEWNALEQPHPLAQGEYILYYTVRSSGSLWASCRALSEKTGMKIVVVGGNAIKVMRNRDPMVAYAVDASPAEWLYLIRHARYVVTNSFHGTAFSAIYRKDFYVELSSATNSRLSHVVRELGLRDRIVSGGLCDGGTACDYAKAEEVLPTLQAASLAYLHQALNEVARHG